MQLYHMRYLQTKTPANGNNDTVTTTLFLRTKTTTQ